MTANDPALNAIAVQVALRGGRPQSDAQESQAQRGVRVSIHSSRRIHKLLYRRVGVLLTVTTHDATTHGFSSNAIAVA